MTVYSNDYLSRVPQISRRPRLGPVGSLVSVILTYRPATRTSTQSLPEYLRKDVGLPPIGDLPDPWERFL
jgi:hypothetical protein